MNTEHDAHLMAAPEQAALEARFGYKITTRLDRDEGALPHHVQERLRVSRLMAIDKARQARQRQRQKSPESTPGLSVVGRGMGAALLGGGGSGGDRASWWVKLGTFAPLAVLVCGLLLVHEWQYQEQIEAAAEVDAALLGDPLPLSAYTDPGFSEFLKEPQDIALE